MGLENKQDSSKVTESSQSTPKKSDSKSLQSKLLWSVVFVAIAGLTIWAISSQSGFSFDEFTTVLKSMNPWWLLAAFGAMFGFIFFEGWAIVTIVKAFGYRKNMGHLFLKTPEQWYHHGDLFLWDYLKWRLAEYKITQTRVCPIKNVY